MSSNKKNTQLLISGLVAAVAVSVLVYFATRPSAAGSTAASATAENKKKWKDDDDTTSSTANRSVNFAEGSSDATPRKSNESLSKKATSSGGGGGSTTGTGSTISNSISEEKELHSKIEELDKKGKAFFKNKQVRELCVRVCVCDCFLIRNLSAWRFGSVRSGPVDEMQYISDKFVTEFIVHLPIITLIQNNLIFLGFCCPPPTVFGSCRCLYRSVRLY
jgi:hypothetical protein